LERRFFRHHHHGNANSTALKESGKASGKASGQGSGQGSGSGALGGPDSNQGVTPANQPTASNSLGLNIDGPDISYLATIPIGTPPQNFLILMDSGSADFWVPSENCQSCGNHQTLGTQSSSTFKDSQNPFSVTYGKGQVQGNIIQDDITVAGLQLKGHTFGVTTDESSDFSADDVPFDGLMGVAQSTLSEQQTATPVEALASAKLIPQAIISFKIPRLADKLNDGEVTFGALDTSKFDQQSLVTLDNVSKEGFWQAKMDAVTVGGKDVGLQGRTAILDTGTTLMIVPDQDAATVNNAIPGAASDGQGGFTIPCDTTTQVALTFGGTSFAIDSRDLNLGPAGDGSNNCISGIASGQVGGANEWLVGDVFLKNAYFSTNVDKNAISLAKLT